MRINNSYSDGKTLDYGLAQGSVLVPRLFNIYVHPFYPYIQALAYEVEGFADDHQLFKSFVPLYQTEVWYNDCLKSVSTWMNTYFLKLNKTKTKILVLAPPNVMSSIEIHGTFMGNKTFRFVSSAKNLGVWLDENLDFKTHICKVVSSCFMVLREIWKVKTFLPKECLYVLLYAHWYFQNWIIAMHCTTILIIANIICYSRCKMQPFD